jgi:glycosyltransferase involved in cell wall biosynthesis
VTPRHTVREQLGVAEGSVLVVAVGRLAVQKGFPLLLEAASRLTDLDVLFVVAGEGPLRGALEDTITRNGLPVRLLGSRRDVPDLLGAADIVASTALWEGQPLNLQEALHAGAAIVATDVGGTGAVLGDAGVLIPGGDAEALAGALRDLVLHPERRAALQARACHRAAELPTDDDAVEAALAGYRSVTGVLGAS